MSTIRRRLPFDPGILAVAAWEFQLRQVDTKVYAGFYDRELMDSFVAAYDVIRTTSPILTKECRQRRSSFCVTFDLHDSIRGYGLRAIGMAKGADVDNWKLFCGAMGDNLMFILPDDAPDSLFRGPNGSLVEGVSGLMIRYFTE